MALDRWIQNEGNKDIRHINKTCYDNKASTSSEEPFERSNVCKTVYPSNKAVT